MAQPTGADQPVLETTARFHRFQVGKLICTSLSDGAIQVPLPPSPPAPGAAQTAATPDARPRFLYVPINCLAVQIPDTGQTVLIDSGFGLTPETLGKPMQSAGRLLESMQAAGLSADAVDVLLISHLDIDHVAGLYNADGTQVFPRATYYASAEAIAFWSKTDIDLSASPVLPWVKAERLLVSAHVLKHSAEHLTVFQAGDEVVPGITATPLPGHAPGQVGFVITSEDDTLLYTADAITHAVVSLATPHVYNPMDLEPDLAVTTRKDLLATLSESGWRSFSPHFPFPSWGRVQKEGDKLVWKPAE